MVTQGGILKVLVTGASGLIGSALVESLLKKGHEAIPLPRRRVSSAGPAWDPERGVIDLVDAGNLDAVVHLAGESIARGRWSKEKKRRILESRVAGTRMLAGNLARSAHMPRVFLCASAVGVYGDRGEELLDESSAPGSGFLAEVCRQWECAAAPTADAGIRTVSLRFGAVLSARGGVLGKMLPLFRMGLGGAIGGGEQYLSWVSIFDAVAMVRHIIACDTLRGPVNLVSPNPVGNREFAKTLGRVLHRPAIVPMPAFLARSALGEKAEALLLSGARVLPGKLTDSGYEFRHPDLDKALESLLGEAQRS